MCRFLLPFSLICSNNKCTTSSQCTDDNHYCLTPSVRNSTRLLYIVRQNAEYKNETPKSVLFWGPPGHLYSTVSMTNYIPKYSFLPYGLPNTMEIVSDYIVKFSGGLAIINLIPCFYLDGYRILGAGIDLILSDHLHAPVRHVLHLTISLLGTFLLVLSLCVGLWSLAV